MQTSKEIVSFQNPGLIPLEAVTTLGVNVKENENPIGYFGTGLKYAIAALLRTHHSITIFIGLEGVEFFSQTETVRGAEIEFIYMSSEGKTPTRLGFTTRLGVNWEPWQIFREVYSNTLDENGVMEFKKLPPREGYTTIHVTGEAFKKAAKAKGEIFLESVPIFKNDWVEIHPKSSSSVFYRGIKAAQLSKDSIYTYNIITKLELTEDRTIKFNYVQNHYIENVLSQCDEKEILEKVLYAKGALEESFRFEFQSAAFSEQVVEIASRRGIMAINHSALAAAEVSIRRRVDPTEAKLSVYERGQITEAVTFLEELGFSVTYPIVVAERLGTGVSGMARNGTIYIAKPTLDKGGNWLIGTILEEYLHLTYGFLDESREFQNYLLDLTIKFAKEAKFNRKGEIQ